MKKAKTGKAETADTMGMSGMLRVRVFRKGVLVDGWEDRNLIVSGGRAAAAILIAGMGDGKRIAKIAFGTDGRVPTPDDTKITGAFVKRLSDVSFPETGHASFSWRLLESEANGLKIAEFGLLCEDGTLWARKIRGEALAKGSDISLEGEWVISH